MAILNVLFQYPGIPANQINAKLAFLLNDRTLKRRLAALIAEGKIIAISKGRARRYQLAQVSEGLNKTGKILLSSEGEKVYANIKRPIIQRTPVGYNRKFLDSYRPNQTFYLTEPIRKQLSDLGRVTNKVEPAGTYAKQIYQRLLIDLSWNSSRLEGNTYSLLETQRLIDLGKVSEGKSAMDTQMILNHKNAIELLIDEANAIGFNRHTILNLHALLSENLLGDPANSGRLRSLPVGIGHTVFHPLELPQLIDECFQQVLATASAINDPFEQSFFMMVHIPYLQPFIDVNKRVSRLSANISLIKQNYCPLSFVDVPHQTYIDGILGVYKLNQVDLLRDVYVWAYQRSCARYSAVQQSLGEPDLFRLKHRDVIFNVVHHVVANQFAQQKAIDYIREAAKQYFIENQQTHFIEVVETELMCLHEGNIARYKITEPQYTAWKAYWN